MRALVALLLIVPLASAQPDVIDWIDAEIAPFAEPIVPLKAAGHTTMRTRVSCLLGDAAIASVAIQYATVEAPSWASVTISPASDVAPMGQCAEGYSELREATLTVSASDQAPAFVPTPIVVEITAGLAERQRKEQVIVNVSASYVSVLDVQASGSLATVPPGGSHDFVVDVTNFGNARTRVVATLADVGDGIAVDLPPPLVLGSRPHGASDISGKLLFRVLAKDDGGAFVNSVEAVNVNLASAYAEDDSFVGDSSAISFLVTVRSGAGADRQNASVPALASPGLALALALAFVSVRRGR